MNVLIVDSSSAIISRIRELLAEEKIICSVYETTAFDKVLEVINEKRPDILIIDLTSPDNTSIEGVKEILTNKNKPEIIALINSSDKQSIEQLKTNGIEFIFDKYHEFQKIPDTIRMISSKRTV